MNIPNVLQTDVVYRIMNSMDHGHLNPDFLWTRTDLKEKALLAEFHRESRLIYKGIEGDLRKVTCAGLRSVLAFLGGRVCCEFCATV